MGKSETGADFGIPEDLSENEDIVVSSFVESYQNLTLKSLSMLYYAEKIINDNRVNWFRGVFAKIDDDVLIDSSRFPATLKSLILKRNAFPKGFLCKLNTNSTPSRTESDKWYVSEREFEPDLFPPYCDGPAYFFRAKDVNSLLEEIEPGETRWIGLEDVFITGILRMNARIAINAASFIAIDHFYPKVITHFRYTDDKLGEMKLLWEFYQNRTRKAMQSTTTETETLLPHNGRR